jgi:hypothetical protein
MNFVTIFLTTKKKSLNLSYPLCNQGGTYLTNQNKYENFRNVE